MDSKRCPKLFGFQHVTVKVIAKWMVELPKIKYRLVGIGAYTRIMSKGGTYHPVFVQLTFKTGVPECLRVRNMVLKVSLKWLSIQDYATGPSLLGSLGLGAS